MCDPRDSFCMKLGFGSVFATIVRREYSQKREQQGRAHEKERKGMNEQINIFSKKKTNYKRNGLYIISEIRIQHLIIDFEVCESKDGFPRKARFWLASM